MVAAALLVGLLLRLLFLGSKSFWLDELISMRFAANPEQLFANRFDDAHPPLFYFLLHYWSRLWLPLSQPEFMLRLFSALAGSLAIPLSYALAIGVAGRRVAYTLLWLTALSPLFVWYAQELRSYSLLVFLSLLVSLAFLHLISRPNLWWWALFIVAMSAAFYTHYAAVLLIAVQLMIAVILYLQQRATRRGLLLWLAAWPVVLLLYAPWLAAPGMRGFLDLMFSDFPYPVYMLAGRLEVSPNEVALLFVVVALLAVLALVVSAVALLRRGALQWQQWAASRTLHYVVLILFFALTVFSVVPRLYTVKKLVIALWPYGLLVVAWLFPWKLSNRVPLALLLCASLLGSIINVTWVPKDQWREMAAYLDAHAEPSDSIWVVPGYQSGPLNYYLVDGTDPAQRPFARSTFAMPDVTASTNDEQLAALANESQRVWLIYHTANYGATDAERRLETWLMEHLVAADQLRLHRIEATLYTLP
jgi:uncharacterized membrane protein